jgi:hypothetical protein
MGGKEDMEDRARSAAFVAGWVEGCWGEAPKLDCRRTQSWETRELHCCVGYEVKGTAHVLEKFKSAAQR